MNRSTLKDLVRDGCRAPSGDNIQPWRFVSRADDLLVYNIPGVHNPHLDFEERGAYIAHGALLENLLIAAPHYGYEASFDIFPDANDPDLVARLHFEACAPRDEPLYAAIQRRATNRHPYENRPLSDEERRSLSGAVTDIPGITFELKESSDDRKTLAHDASRAEIVILEDTSIAAHFFAGMVWTQEEELRKREGFFVKTMELGRIQHLVFWLASKPWLMRWFRKIGLPRFVAHEDAKLYASGAAVGGVSLPDESPESFLAAGRALERIWLTATEKGLALQPLIGMNFIAHRVVTDRARLADVHANEMRRALGHARSLLAIPEKNVLAFLFRVGHAPEPSVMTSRRDPSIDFL